MKKIVWTAAQEKVLADKKAETEAWFAKNALTWKAAYDLANKETK